MQHFHYEVAAITGAESGIGRGIARQLAHWGSHLALSDDDGLAETVALVEQSVGLSSNVKVTSARVDVTERDAV